MKAKIKKNLPILIGKSINILSYVAPKMAGSKAFDLFCTPWKGRLRPRDEEFLNQAEEKQLLSNGEEQIQSYVWNSTGEQTILLIHGWESNSARWRFLIPILLEKGYRVVCIDAPAHGASEGKYLHLPKYSAAVNSAVIEYQPDYLVGHSLGGKAVAYYLSHYSSSNIKKFILLGVAADLEIMSGYFGKMLGLSKRSIDNFNKHLKNKFDKTPDYFSYKTYCPKIEVPALIIHDKNDPITKVENGFHYHENLKHSQLMVTDKLGHSLQDAMVYSKVLSFIEEDILYPAY